MLEIVCVRCGVANEVNLQIIPEDDCKLYKCTYCKFVIVNTYLREQSEPQPHNED